MSKITAKTPKGTEVGLRKIEDADENRLSAYLGEICIAYGGYGIAETLEMADRMIERFKIVLKD